jgi:energy-coupling factor transporter ATP-binding protein EcfA2
MNLSEDKVRFYDAFNARSLRPQEVAESFVPSAAFFKLAKRRHSVVIGPRGTGKTTLLKMLQQPAMEHWSHDMATAVRASIDYTGVFIPTDITWRTQLASLGIGSLSADESRLLSRSAFTTHVLRALVTAMLSRISTTPAPFPHRRCPLRAEEESSLTKQIADCWKLQPRLPSLVSLKHALTVRLAYVRELASKEDSLGPEGRDRRFADEAALHLPYLEAVMNAVEVFDDTLGLGSSHWALLFDELELAPDWIREQLFGHLRSVDDRLVFKLSISPYDQHIQTTSICGPTADNDYDAIPLWYAQRENGYTFCKALWESMLVQRGIVKATAESTLGPSMFDTDHGRGEAYGRRSRHRRRFIDLANDDATFARYLANKGLDLTALDAGTEEQRASEVRKIISLVAVRHAYRRPDRLASRQTVRSRKNPRLFVGAKSLFAMVEANPRWLIAIGNRLLDAAADGGLVSPRIQNRELTDAANRFIAMLEAIPCSLPAPGFENGSIASIVSSIGHFFFKCTVLEDFNPDPPGSFVIDEQLPAQVIDSLGKALNVGAIVQLPDSESQLPIGKVAGKRFRLCYLLAAVYRFPIRLGRPVSLSHILKDQTDAISTIRLSAAPESQRELFNGTE